MNRLQNAQKQLVKSLSALESAVEQAQNSTALAATGNGAGAVESDRANAPALRAQVIDTAQLFQDLTAIEADLETAMKMIANLTASGLSSGQDKDSL